MDTQQENIIDLEKVRDEKCIPLARGVLHDMAECMIPEDANVKIDFNPVLLKILQRTLDADTNITQENPYIFQLLLGVFGGLNKTVQSCTLVPIDDLRYGAIAKKILEIVAKGNVRMGKVSTEESDMDFAPIREELNGLFVQEKLSLVELKYIMDNILDSFKTVQDLFARNVEQSSAKAIAKSLGLEYVDDLTMQKLDSVLKSS